MIVELYRHAACASNARHVYIGATDEPCDPAALAALAPIDTSDQLVYVTNRIRTQQTAQKLFPHARLHIVPGLEEMDFGIFEGKAAHDMEHDEVYRAWVNGGCVDICPGGESRHEFSQRCCQAFSQIVHENLEQDISRIRLVVHGGTIMAILESFGVPARDYFAWHVEPACHITAYTDVKLWNAHVLKVLDAT